MTNSQAALLHFQDTHHLSIMPEKFPYKLCRIADLGGTDLSKPWYVEYYVWDHTAEKQRRRRHMLTDTTAKKRYEHGKRVAAEIDEALQAGAVMNEKKAKVKGISAESKLTEAVEYFLSFSEKTTKKRTFMSYASDLNHLTRFQQKHELAEVELAQFTNEHANQFLDDIIIIHKLSTRRRNNLRGTMSTLFNFFRKRKVIAENPFHEIQKLPSIAGKHVAYTPDKLAKFKALITNKEPQLWLFINFIYFAFIRPGEELRRLRVRDIRKTTINIEGENAKNNTTQHILIPTALEEIIQENNLRSYHEDHYVFSHNGPGTELVGKNYFYTKHKKLLEKMKFDQSHDLYSWKHTGVIALFQATQNIELIRQQCRHSDIATTQKYLRDLGCFINYDEINKFPAI
jgi:site-specific recombinase XerD